MTTGEQLDNISSVTNVPAWVHLMNAGTFISSEITTLDNVGSTLLAPLNEKSAIITQVNDLLVNKPLLSLVTKKIEDRLTSDEGDKLDAVCPIN